MEVPLPLQRPVCCRAGIDKQFLRFSPQSFVWQKEHVAGRVSFRVSASMDFSRRRPKRSTSPRTKDSAPRTASARRRDQKNNEEKEGPVSRKANGGRAGSSRKTTELDVGNDDEGVADVNHVTNAEEQSVVVEGESVAETLFSDGSGQPKVNGGLPKRDNYIELTDARTIPSTEVSNVEKLAGSEEVDMSSGGGIIEENRVYSRGGGAQWRDHMEIAKKEATTVANAETNASHETDVGVGGIAPGSNDLQVAKAEKNASRETDIGVGGIVPGSNDLQESVSDNTVYNSVESLSAKAKSVGEVTSSNSKDKSKEEYFLKLKLESEGKLRKEILARLAEENFKQGNKIFCYPELVKPDEDIEIFFNRSFSTLKNEPEVLIMGAFNDWKWRSFTIKLSKADIHGDWWSCRLHVPREAYKIDFVLNNGNDVYENNEMKDFCINVEGGMDAFDFENFLLEEKRREQEEIARLEAENERQAEEQRRIEAEKAASDADRAQAREEVAKRRAILQEMMKKAEVSLENVWYVEPSEFGGEDAVRLYYNRSSGPLVNAKAIWIHGGYNNWKNGLSLVSELVRSDNKGVDWWYADVVVPDQALVLDWVFADGPPQQATVYDNNSRQDFHAIVPNAVHDEPYWVQEEQEIYRRLQAERRAREEAMRLKVEKTALMKAKTKEATLKTFLLSRKHIVLTDPIDVQAGSTVTLSYNPANTVLNGKPEVWLRCSFNRWTHRLGPLPAQKMVPAQDGPHLKATVNVPLDAYMMDFVFSESEDGGLFDNNNGMDYHIPVFGGVAKEPSMHIVHIAVEMAPIAKVGGLGDVVTSLSRAVQEMNHNVDVILPKYDCLNLSNVKDLNFHKSYSWGGTEIKVWRGKVEGVSVYFLEPQNGLFWVGCIYGRANDGERFGFFCHAALEFLLQSGFHPDIIHCHDWSSAPVAWLFKEQYMHYGLSKARVVFTIHNLDFGQNMIGRAMTHTDKATTVSPTYSQEVSGHPAVAPHLYKFHGILNGIDPDIWDPYNDKFIPIPYTPENVVEGKVAAKEALQQKLGLKKADLPLVGIITRLTHQKGIHLIKHAIWRTLERNGQVVLLGSAPDPRIQNEFVNLANQLHSSYNDRARLCLSYDEPLSHLIYAGADFILVPSIFEPCGLTQLTAMRYGSIPVVRKTGGLYDTVFDVDHDKERAQACGLEPNGFSFDGADAAGVDYALNRALSAWYDGREWFNSLCKRVMEQDWSWNRPALDYLELYHAARK